MAFEELPSDYEDFFKNGGELPQSLLAQVTPPPVEAPAPAAAPVAQAEAPVPAPAVIPDAPAVPTGNPYLERLLAEKDAQVQALAEQMTKLQEQMQRATEVPAPDPTTDPLGHMTHTLAKLQEQLTSLQNSQKEAQTQTQQQTQQQQFHNAINQQVQTFKSTHTDYDDAYKHMINTRVQDFRDLGMTETQIREAIGNEEMQITRQAIAQGKNPAELVYNFAKRYGYQAKAAAISPENKLATIQKGMEASQTTERGTPPETGKIDIDSLRAGGVPDRMLDKMVVDDWEGIFGVRKGVV